MKKTLILLALGSVSLIFADQYTQSYPQARVSYPSGYTPNYASCPAGGGGSYQDQRTSQDPRASQDQRAYLNQKERANQSQGGGQRSDQYSDDQDDDDQDDQDYDQQSDMRSPNAADRDLDKRVRDAISSGWFSRGYQGVRIRINNGNVMLRGIVDSEENKKKVEDTVRKIDGVKQVDNQIRVKQDRDSRDSRDRDARDNRNRDTGSARMQNRDSTEKMTAQDQASNPQDRQLNARIRERLENSGIRGREMLILKTTDGVVIISGNIDRMEDSQRLHNLIRGIEGVRSVNNQLNVKNK